MAACRAELCIACAQAWQGAHRVAEPLHSRDGDGAIEGACTEGQPLSQVTHTEVPLHLPVQGHIQHRLADIHALLTQTLC